MTRAIARHIRAWAVPVVGGGRRSGFLPRCPASLGLPTVAKPQPVAAAPEKLPWPDTAVEQLTALGALLARGPATAEAAADAFEGANRKLVERHLETLALIGEASVDGAGRYGKVGRVG